MIAVIVSGAEVTGEETSATETVERCNENVAGGS